MEEGRGGPSAQRALTWLAESSSCYWPSRTAFVGSLKNFSMKWVMPSLLAGSPCLGPWVSGGPAPGRSPHLCPLSFPGEGRHQHLCPGCGAHSKLPKWLCWGISPPSPGEVGGSGVAVIIELFQRKSTLQIPSPSVFLTLYISSMCLRASRVIQPIIKHFTWAFCKMANAAPPVLLLYPLLRKTHFNTLK